MQYKKFGEFIRAKRTGMKMPLNCFAIECEIDPATLSNFERGKSDILFQNFIKLAKGFNTKPSELIHEFEKNNI